MIYLLDANVLMTAHNTYYPIDRVPEYWEWLIYQAEKGRVKVPLEIFEEVKEGPDEEGKDLLFDWINTEETKEALLFLEEADPDSVNHVVTVGYANDLTDSEIEQIGRDPFLISYALNHAGQRCVVTNEVSKPSRIRQNRKVPDVCNDLGVRSIDPFTFMKELNFTTNWRLA